MTRRAGLIELHKKGIKEFEVIATIRDFSTTVSREGVTIPTMLLVNICDTKTGKQLAEHAWTVVRYNTGQTFAKGKKIKFIANMQHYSGGRISIGYLRPVKK